MQRQITEEQYTHFNNLQYKNEEISKLKHDLKQAQNQIRILRKTMKQMLKSDGKDSFDDNDFSSVDESVTRSRKRYLYDITNCKI
jgi:ribosome recycling factor